MNGKAVMSDDFIKIGADVYEAACEFLMTTVSALNGGDIREKNNKILQAIKIKYADSKNDGEEFESASEASDEDPNRDKIE